MSKLTLIDLAKNEYYVVTDGSALNQIQSVSNGERVISKIFAAKIMGKMVANKEIWILSDGDKKIGASFRVGADVDWYQKSFINNSAISSAVINELISDTSQHRVGSHKLTKRVRR